MKDNDAMGCLAIPFLLWGAYLALKLVWTIIRAVFGFIWECIGESVIAFDELMKILISPLCSFGDTIKIIVWAVFWMLVIMGFLALIGGKRSK